MSDLVSDLPSIILDILEESSQALSVDEVARRATDHPQWEMRHWEVPPTLVENVLRHGLPGQVSNSNGLWTRCRRSVGREPAARPAPPPAAPSPEPAPLAARPPAVSSSPPRQADPEATSENDPVTAAVLLALREATRPLTATQIATVVRVSLGVRTIDSLRSLTDQVETALTTALAGRVTQPLPGYWRLRQRLPSVTTPPVPPPAPVERPSPAEVPARPSTSTRGEVALPIPPAASTSPSSLPASPAPVASEEPLRPPRPLPVASPGGSLPFDAAKDPLKTLAALSKAFEHARLVATALALAGGPRDAERLAERLRASGVPISAREVTTLLETTLRRWVTLGAAGWTFGASAVAAPADAAESAPAPDVRARVVRAPTSSDSTSAAFDSPAFFTYDTAGPTTVLTYNRAHPAGRCLSEGTLSVDDVVAAWARMESDLRGARRERAQELREDWGRALRSTLRSASGTPDAHPPGGPGSPAPPTSS